MSGLLGRKAEEREKGDARILGSGDFVSETLPNSRQRKLSEAKALVAYLAVEEGGHTLTEVGSYLGMKHSSVSYAVRRGERLLGLQQVTNEDRE